MSIKQMSKVWEWSRSEGNTRLVCLALADHADDDGFCYPGVPRLAKKCRISERTVQRAIRELEELGELKCKISSGAKVDGHGFTNRYQLTISGCQSVTPEFRGDRLGQTGVTNQANRGDSLSPKPSEEPSEEEPSTKGVGSASLGASEEEKKIAPSNEIAIRLAKCVGRQPTTAWSQKEIKAFKVLMKSGIAEQDLVAVEVYYLANRKLERNICRRDLLTLLNNFPGEVDRAKAWIDSQPNRRGGTHKPQEEEREGI